jgi:uncharacterized protein (TIGR03083 family)
VDPFIPILQDSVDRFATVLRAGPLDAPVPSCPGWDVHRLARHLGYVQRWSGLATEQGRSPDPAEIDELGDDASAEAVLTWFLAGADRLVAALEAVEPDAPTWHPFPVAKVAAVWRRRQAHEAFVHAWDAESAIGSPAALDPAIAADGVAEYFEVMVPRRIERDGTGAPVGVLEVVCTDATFHTGSDRMVVRVDTPTSVVVDRSATPTGRLTGGAEELLLALWARRPVASPPTDPLAAAWLAHGGN